MNTPRTDAIDTYQPFVVSSEKYKELANLSRQLETQAQELRDALTEILTYPSGQYSSHGDFDAAFDKAKSILEKNK